jgi:hypothetical protein
VRSALALALAGLALSAAQAAASPYFGARFRVTRHPYSFLHGPSWAANGDVLSFELDRAGLLQIYRSRLNGSRQRCLTCRTVQGPNGLPQDRPQGDWILFESHGQQAQHLGAPGLGGYGGDLYAMREDGSHPYRLTTRSDPPGAVPYDNFHAYWSPDGRQVVWTHTEAYPLAQGGQRWEMLLGDFRVSHGVPSLRNVRVVGRPYGVYETQPWAPDGSGFLFSAAGGYRSPFQASPPGWGHMQLYYMRLYGRGASPAHPRVTQISDDLPVYQEQAVFTPDMRTVIMMSDRGSPQQSWYDLVVAAAQRTRFDAPDTGSTGTLQFLADFSGQDFHSDLYAVDVATGATRRLTNFRDAVVPEFFWNRGFTQLLWTAARAGSPPRWTTYTGEFERLGAAVRKPPRRIPAPGLYGRPVEMRRVGAQAQPVRDAGPTGNPPIAVRPPADPAAARPHAPRTSDTSTAPAVVLSYLGLWQSQLVELGRQAMESFTSPPLAAAAGGDRASSNSERGGGGAVRHRKQSKPCP